MAEAPVFCVTVTREVAGCATRLFQYAGDPHAGELQTLLDYVTQMVVIDGIGTRVDVAIGATSVPPELTCLADALRALSHRNGDGHGTAVP